MHIAEANIKYLKNDDVMHQNSAVYFNAFASCLL